MTRINKWLSEMGVCSRKQADELIQQDLVLVNNLSASLGMKISNDDVVTVNGLVISHKPETIYLLYHKPVGVVCTHDLSVENNIEQSLNYPQRVFAVGRLDKASEGLMLLTNQGDSVNKIMRAENHHQKVYQVWVKKAITDEFIDAMASGVAILNTVTLPCEVKKITEHQFQITLVQGLNLQIRRMCKALGYRVERLQRTQIMQFSLDNIALGRYRLLDKREQKQLLQSLDSSVNVL